MPNGVELTGTGSVFPADDHPRPFIRPVKLAIGLPTGLTNEAPLARSAWPITSKSPATSTKSATHSHHQSDSPSQPRSVIQAGQVGSNSSVLIVVGREDTGELEAQVRGSRHAWDMRLISTDALIKLVELKEQAEGADTGQKIRSLLTPREYTRLDEMVEVMFAAAKDVEYAVGTETLQEEEVPNPGDATEKQKGSWVFTDSALLQEKREKVVSALAKREGIALIRKSRALYWSPSHDLRAAFTISKRYTKKGGAAYWYAYHPLWRTFLSDCERGYLVLGCMDRDEVFAIPVQILTPLIEHLNTTEKDDGDLYLHLHLHEGDSGKLSLSLPKQKTLFPVIPFALVL